MALESPKWWYEKKKSPIAKALSPLSWIWGAVASARMSSPSKYHSPLPVICIGNFTMGGAGKTPTAIAFCEYLKSMGEQPAFLSRGYGGELKGPHLVNPEVDTATRVGDEPLLLSRHAPTFISSDRIAGAKMIEASKATVIIMDDGFQNTSLHKDLNAVVVDGGAGIGNGMVAPAGPLRAPIEQQLTMCDAMIILRGGDEDHESLRDLTKAFRGHAMSARIVPSDDTDWLRAAKVIAYAGIGRPEKFFHTVGAITPNVIGTMSFPDHHSYTEKEAQDLVARAFSEDAILLTTEKDWVRLPLGNDAINELKEQSHTLPIRLEFDGTDETQLAKLIDIALSTRQDH